MPNNIAKWCVNIITLFPEMFPGILQYSIAGKNKEKSWDLKITNMRDFALDKHQTVDDTPYGGGAGMVIRPDIIGSAIDSLPSSSELVYFSPRGELFNQRIAEEFISKDNLAFICGRYEGVDQRVIDYYNVREVSIGDFILSGGEVAALTVLDACIRLLPSVMHNQNSLREESFSCYNNYTNLLEYPHYTRPYIWKEKEVPNILLSGHHEKISNWRLEQAENITKHNRPDLWKKYLADDS